MSLLALIGLLFVLYIIFRFVWESLPPKMSPRRKLAMAAWGEPSEPACLGMLEINLEKAQKYIDSVSEKSGEKITLTTYIGKALGLAYRKVPRANVRMLLGKFIPRNTIDICFLVSLTDEKTGRTDLSKVKVCNTDNKSLKAISQELKHKAHHLRSGKDENHKKTTGPLELLPVPVIRAIATLSGWLTSSLNLSIPALGLEPSPFGTAIVTSIANFDLSEGFVPFTPFTRCPVFVAIGKAGKRPVVDENDKIVVQNQVRVTATIDHRYFDGKEIGELASAFRFALENPEKAFQGVEFDSSDATPTTSTKKSTKKE